MATQKTTTKAQSFKLLVGTKDIQAAIDSIANRGKKLDRDIHVAGVSCLAHLEEHGDVTLLQKLIEAMPKSGRKNALIEWAIKFGKVVSDEAGKNVVYDRDSTTDIENATAISPWDFKPEPAFKPFDLQAELTKVLNRALKAAEDTEHQGEHKVDAEILKELQRLTANE